MEKQIREQEQELEKMNESEEKEKVAKNLRIMKEALAEKLTKIKEASYLDDYASYKEYRESDKGKLELGLLSPEEIAKKVAGKQPSHQDHGALNDPKSLEYQIKICKDPYKRKELIGQLMEKKRKEL